MKRIQKMPPCLNTVTWENLADKHTYVWFYPDRKTDEKHPCEMHLEDALKKCASAEAKGFEAYVSAYVPAFGQHMVVAMTTHGRLHDAFFGNPGKEAEMALTALLKGKETEKETTFQCISKDKKDTRLACRVVFDGSKNTYTYKCRKWHVVGDLVTVKVRDEFKVVKVVETFITTEREMKNLATRLGYEKISELYCEEGIAL